MSKRQRTGYEVVNAKIRPGVVRNLGGVSYQVMDTYIPRTVINNLKRVWNQSNRGRKEFSGSFKFGIRLNNSGQPNGVYYGLNKNERTGQRGGVIILDNTISYHTHPGPGAGTPESNILFTIPSGQDLGMYLSRWPKDQINMILDQHGIIVLDVNIDRVLEIMAQKRLNNIDQWANMVRDDFNKWTDRGIIAPGWELRTDTDGFYFYRVSNTRSLEQGRRAIINKISEYGINCSLHGWNAQRIPVAFETLGVEKSRSFGPSTITKNRTPPMRKRKIGPKYVYKKNGKEFGPFGVPDMLKKYTKGSITDRTLVRPDAGTAYTMFKTYRIKFIENDPKVATNMPTKVLNGISEQKLKKIYNLPSTTKFKNAVAARLKRIYESDAENQFTKVYNAMNKSKRTNTMIRNKPGIKATNNGGLTNSEIEIIKNYFKQSQKGKELVFRVTNAYVNRKMKNSPNGDSRSYQNVAENQFAKVYNAINKSRRLLGGNIVIPVPSIRNRPGIKASNNGGLTNAEIEIVRNYFNNSSKKSSLKEKVKNAYMKRKMNNLRK